MEEGKHILLQELGLGGGGGCRGNLARDIFLSERARLVHPWPLRAPTWIPPPPTTCRREPFFPLFSSFVLCTCVYPRPSRRRAIDFLTIRLRPSHPEPYFPCFPITSFRISANCFVGGYSFFYAHPRKECFILMVASSPPLKFFFVCALPPHHVAGFWGVYLWCVPTRTYVLHVCSTSS